MLANVVGGALFWAVHLLSRRTGPEEYGLFVTFLSLVMFVQANPLQMVMAQQTAKALATNREGELASVTRAVWLGTSVLWLAGVAFVVVMQKHILARWQVTNPAGLWITVVAVLLAFWVPMFQGLLQGQQNFLWLGWSMMLNAVGRITVAAMAVLAFGCLAAGMMTGVLLGLVAGVGIALWQTRSVWLAPAQPFDWRSLLRQVIPLMLGCSAVQFLFTADTMFVKAYFTKEDVGFYGSAGTLSRALMWLVVPLATVMFPRIVHSTAKAEKTNILGVVLAGTAILSVAGAAGLAVLGPLAVRIVNGADYVVKASAWLPWYAAAMVPLALANVLVNALLAKSSFRVVPSLCLLALAYAFALTRFHDSPVMVLQTLGLFNLLLLGICAWFTWSDKAPSVARAGRPL